MRVCEDEKADRFGNYPALRIRGKDANPQKIHEELWGRSRKGNASIFP